MINEQGSMTIDNLPLIIKFFRYALCAMRFAIFMKGEVRNG